METTVRFGNAVTKLYNAFHKGELDAMSCKMCAVGNICDNQSEWDNLPFFASTVKWGGDPSEDAHEDDIKKAYRLIKKTGYSVEELINIESLFLIACGYSNGNKEQQFKGLCAVVKYLCELDNIPNVMDYTKLFETENELPKYQLV